LLVGFPLAFLWFREPPKEPVVEVRSAAGTKEVGWTLVQAMGTLAFWQLSLFYFLGAVGVFGALTHAIPLLTDRGLDRASSAALMSIFGVSVGLGRLVTGQLLDMFKAERLVATLFLLPAAGCLLLLFGGGNVALCGLGLSLLGFAGGVEGDSGAYLVARYFGRAHFGAIYGLLIALTILGGGVGPLLIGYSFDKTGSYDLSLAIGIATFLAASLLVLTLRWDKARFAAA
jgi:predicted MFS family arabinose efflux permease